MQDSPWTAEVLSHLTTLWTDGHSSGWIAIELGLTRNQVMGKIFRMQAKSIVAARPTTFLKTRGPAGLRRSPRKRAKQMTGEPDQWGIVGDDKGGEPVGIPFLELKPFQCHAPLDRVDEQGTMVSCGAHTCTVRSTNGDHRSPYCAEHHRLFHIVRRDRGNGQSSQAARSRDYPTVGGQVFVGYGGPRSGPRISKRVVCETREDDQGGETGFDRQHGGTGRPAETH